MAATSCPTASAGVHHYAPGAGKTVALTFDDGPGVTTAAILSILQRYGVPATFFNVGVNASVRPTLVRSEVVAGHVVGNHTWDHPEMPTLSTTGQAAEMDQATALQRSQIAVSPCVFRPPYGEYNSTTLALGQQRGMTVWNWSVDTEDWKAGTSTSSTWVDRIVSRAIAGGSQSHPVVLMHNPPAGIPANVSALPRIIEYYGSHGYRFVDLLGGTQRRAPTPGAATTSVGLHVVTRGSSADVVERTLRRTTWSGSSSLGGSVVGGPAAAALGPASTAVVAAGNNNAVYRNTVTDAGVTTGWTSLGGVTTTRPGITVAPNGVESIVVRGGTGQVYIKQRVGGQWSGWVGLGGLLTPFAPAVAVTTSGVLTVAAVAGDRAMWVKHRSASGAWTGWSRVGGSITSDIALSPTADGTRLVAVVRGGQNGYVAIGNADGTSWSGWQNIGGGLSSGPAATVNGSALEVLVIGGDRIYRNTAIDGTSVTGWTGWRSLP
ncbi:MAG TPA: polysaccharide deacetylase family protein [Mycobacteriales bacterium]